LLPRPSAASLTRADPSGGVQPLVRRDSTPCLGGRQGKGDWAPLWVWPGGEPEHVVVGPGQPGRAARRQPAGTGDAPAGWRRAARQVGSARPYRGMGAG